MDDEAAGNRVDAELRQEACFRGPMVNKRSTKSSAVLSFAETINRGKRNSP